MASTMAANAASVHNVSEKLKTKEDILVTAIAGARKPNKHGSWNKRPVSSYKYGPEFWWRQIGLE